MTSINPAAGVSVPLQGTLAQEVLIARNSAAPAGPGPVSLSALAGPPASLARLASIQGSLSPLLADLGAALARPGLPQAVRGAAQTVLSYGLDAVALDGETVRAAILKSGAFPQGVPATDENGRGDLKFALLSLRNALRKAVSESVRTAVPSSSGPPPYRAAQPVGELPSLASIALLDGEALHAKLLSETEAALARATLLQLASLPETAQGNTTQRLVVEIPMATPQGHAVIQFQIEPEDHPGDRQGGARAPSWRVRFAIDIEPIGPVRASVTQIDGRTHVNLFAEREASARALRDDLPALQTQLAQAALEPGDLHCRSGAPPREPAPPGLFVDRAS